jgi:nucleoid DNA-binding protein
MASDDTTGKTTKSGAAGPKAARAERAAQASRPKATDAAGAVVKDPAKARPKAQAKDPAKAKSQAKKAKPSAKTNLKARPAGAGKTAAAVGQPEPATAGSPMSGSPMSGALRLKDLVEQVSSLTGSRKRDVKPVVEATLSALGQALAADRVLALPTFGKARVNRHRESGGGETLTIKLRRREGGKANEGLAASEE